MTDLATDLMNHAALAGPFSPARYLRGQDLSDTDVQAALSHLAAHCMEERSEDGVLWQMRPDSRAKVLNSWEDPVATAKRCFRRWKPLTRDHVASAIYEFLVNGTVNKAAIKGLNTKDVISAASFLTPIFPAGKVRALRRLEVELYDQLVQKHKSDRQNDILSGKLIGRDAELNALHSFAAGDPVAGPITAIGAPQKSPHRALLLSAGAGVGKSAFLTQFLRDRAATGDWTLVLDFELLILKFGDPVSWSAEISRQVGLAAPHLATVLAMARRSSNDTDGTDTTGGLHNHDPAHLLEAMDQILAALPRRNVVLILENLQEITSQDSIDNFRSNPAHTVLGALMDWLGKLQPLFGGLSIIAALPALPATADPSEWFQARLDLHDLGPDGAAALLAEFAGKKQPLDAKDAAEIARIVGGHPPHLQMVQRFLRDNPGRNQAQFLHDLEKALRGIFVTEMKPNVLLSACLRNCHAPGAPIAPDLSDDALQKLIDTGLPLRILDAEILRHAVAPTAGLRLSKTQADQAMKALAAQGWMFRIQSETPLCIEYRGAIRRADLRERLNVAASQAQQLNQLLDRAAGIYDNRKNLTELAYVAALRGDVTPFCSDPVLAGAVYGLALPDLPMFAPMVRATLLCHADPTAMLSTAELNALPEHLKGKAETAAAVQRDARSRKFGFPSP